MHATADQKSSARRRRHFFQDGAHVYPEEIKFMIVKINVYSMTKTKYCKAD